MRNSTTPRLVAIVGGSGAGKSWLTDRLQKVFGDKAARPGNPPDTLPGAANRSRADDRS